jgi:hypothetical protein
MLRAKAKNAFVHPPLVEVMRHEANRSREQEQAVKEARSYQIL